MYLGAAVLLFGGLPPFYRRYIAFEAHEFERCFIRFFPVLLGVALPVFLFVETRDKEFFLLSGVISFWGGILIRKELSQSIGSPLPWITDIWIAKWPVWSVRFPMLIFDIWTLSFTAAMTLLLKISV